MDTVVGVIDSTTSLFSKQQLFISYAEDKINELSCPCIFIPLDKYDLSIPYITE